ncbi:MAG: prevent-host-death family protein [Desulfobacterales bacterium CG23_combo_of_CG06-09_8_20_14_all_51_8]|nr:MAG: prevent-host-death family protein [Desulfobacterales bacterium CG23_combo_of_CG06-09_8_20_14_all_51_8]
MELNVQIIKKNGKNEFVVLPYDEFQKIQEELASYEDLRCLREAKIEERDAPTIGISELKKIITGRTSAKSNRPRKLGG